MPLNISIIGLDVVGGSLGLALGTMDRDLLTTGRPVITGWDSNNRSVRDARDRLLIDRPAQNIVDAVRDADVVFVTGEFPQISEVLTEIAPHLKHGAIVSDTSTTKARVQALAQRVLPTTVDFVGGHPLVRRSGGPKDTKADLFRGMIYCLVPAANARPVAMDTIAALVEAIGAKPYYIDAAEHDSYIATARHLPLLLSAALMESVLRGGGWREIQPIAGEAFRQVTQLVEGDPASHANECAGNSEALAQRIDEFIRLLIEMRDNLGNNEQLEATFAHAQNAYMQWMNAQPNMRPGENDYYGNPASAEPSRGLNSLFFGQRKRSGRK